MDRKEKQIRHMRCALDTAKNVLSILTADPHPFGDYLRAARERKGMTQKEFAKWIGASASYYIKCEKGERGPLNPDLVEFAELAHKLGVSVREIDGLYRQEWELKRRKINPVLRENLRSLLYVVNQALE